MVGVPPLCDRGCVPWVARAPRRTFRTDAGGCGQVRFGWVAVLLALATAAGESLRSRFFTDCRVSSVPTSESPVVAHSHVVTWCKTHGSGFYAFAFLGQGALGKGGVTYSLCPDRVVRLVMQRTSGSRRTQQLLVAFGDFLFRGQPCLPRGFPLAKGGCCFWHTLTRGERALMLRAHLTCVVSGLRSRLWPDARVTKPL